MTNLTKTPETDMNTNGFDLLDKKARSVSRASWGVLFFYAHTDLGEEQMAAYEACLPTEPRYGEMCKSWVERGVLPS